MRVMLMYGRYMWSWRHNASVIVWVKRFEKNSLPHKAFLAGLRGHPRDFPLMRVELE